MRRKCLDRIALFRHLFYVFAPYLQIVVGGCLIVVERHTIFVMS